MRVRIIALQFVLVSSGVLRSTGASHGDTTIRQVIYLLALFAFPDRFQMRPSSRRAGR
jgi:hypothetical protein